METRVWLVDEAGSLLVQVTCQLLFVCLFVRKCARAPICGIPMIRLSANHSQRLRDGLRLTPTRNSNPQPLESLALIPQPHHRQHNTQSARDETIRATRYGRGLNSAIRQSIHYPTLWGNYCTELAVVLSVVRVTDFSAWWLNSVSALSQLLLASVDAILKATINCVDVGIFEYVDSVGKNGQSIIIIRQNLEWSLQYNNNLILCLLLLQTGAHKPL